MKGLMLIMLIMVTYNVQFPKPLSYRCSYETRKIHFIEEERVLENNSLMTSPEEKIRKGFITFHCKR